MKIELILSTEDDINLALLAGELEEHFLNERGLELIAIQKIKQKR